MPIILNNNAFGRQCLPAAHAPLPYRQDLDGLRALAIVPVVLFHAGIPVFSGGYVGVDVFFVISGYLITSLIQQEIQDDCFSLRRFYERRVRRIFPALFAVLASCMICAVGLLYPEDYQPFARSLIAASLFVSSFLFSRETGYFDGAAEDKPLLHTWSLSVEEIFYLIFPLALVFLFRRLRRHLSGILLILGLSSLAASIVALRLEPHSPAVFFLAQYRVWELLLGALLATWKLPLKINHPHANVLTVIGLLMIAGAVFGYSKLTPFPGAAALLPCLGAALVICSGHRADSLPQWLLTNKVMVFFGLISYSLYLWHWPLLVFFPHWAEHKPDAMESGLLVIAAVALAYLSWRFIERPFRGSQGLLSQRNLFLAATSGLALFVGVGLQGELTQGWPERYDLELQAIFRAASDRDPRQEECLSPRPESRGCHYGAPGVTPQVVLWGDSHAAVFADLLGKLAARRGQAIQVFTMWSCPPTPGWQLANQPWQNDCARLQNVALDTILQSLTIHSIVLATRFAEVAFIPDREKVIGIFYRTVDRLLSAGKRVILVYPVPELGTKLSVGMNILQGHGKVPGAISIPTQEYRTKTRFAFDVLDALGDRNNLIRIQPHELLCDEDNCFASRAGTGYYFDTQHLSLNGAELFAPLFDHLLFGYPTAKPGNP